MDTLNDYLLAWLAGLGWHGQAVLKLLLAAVLGGLVGMEREVRGREAGFRTNLLVCVGSALVLLVSVRFAEIEWHPQGAYNINIDPARIAYGVMTGIGFLGAGAILKQEASVRGLTTAASLWCVAAIGMAVGLGLYLLSAAATLIVLVALWLLDYAEEALPRLRHRRLIVRCRWGADRVEQVARIVESAGMKVGDRSFRMLEDGANMDVELTVTYSRRPDLESAERQLRSDPECRLVASVQA